MPTRGEVYYDGGYIDEARRRIAYSYNVLRKKHDESERICPFCDCNYDPVIDEDDWNELHNYIAILLSIYCDEVPDDLNSIDDVTLYGCEED